MERLTGRVAFVTGAGSGIGRATAIALAREGASVFLTDIDMDGGRITADLIQKAGGTLRLEEPGTGPGSRFTIELPLDPATAPIPGSG